MKTDTLHPHQFGFPGFFGWVQTSVYWHAHPDCEDENHQHDGWNELEFELVKREYERAKVKREE